MPAGQFRQRRFRRRFDEESVLFVVEVSGEAMPYVPITTRENSLTG